MRPELENAADNIMLSTRDEENSESRASFIGRAAGLVLAGLGIATSGLGSPLASEGAPVKNNDHNAPLKRKGKRDSKIKRWDVVTIGNLSRNRYWGESDARGVRSAICTCTAVAGEGFRLVVDPSLSDADKMAAELDRRTGLKSSEITVVFITHDHGDHHAGLKHFPNARWLAGVEVAAILNKSKRYSKPIEAADKRILDAIDVIHTPGHTPNHHSLRFDCDGLSVVLAGDAVATRDFWLERRAYYNAVDAELAARIMESLATIADIIVPGHDNYFLVLPSA
jgi:glyoxylase-like metal-dependent hydrolase (beta-lactamase superfamily II)